MSRMFAKRGSAKPQNDVQILDESLPSCDLSPTKFESIKPDSNQRRMPSFSSNSINSEPNDQTYSVPIDLLPTPPLYTPINSKQTRQAVDLVETEHIISSSTIPVYQQKPIEETDETPVASPPLMTSPLHNKPQANPRMLKRALLKSMTASRTKGLADFGGSKEEEFWRNKYEQLKLKLNEVK
jgi:hypothetical protein